ncbi:MAG: NUDIX domain-containing protein [Patescibacteria group bacterium]|nr:NUDIX domain-containing protein [Patescibacteria group bacterium]
MKTVDGLTISNEKIIINVDDLYFRPSIYAIIIKDNQLLMTKFGKYGYFLPGGGIDLGEDHIDTLIRELKEETGYTVEVGDLLDIQTAFFKSPIKEKYSHTIKIFYKAEIISENPEDIKLTESENILNVSVEWVNLSEIENLKMAGDDGTLLEIVKNCIKK